MRKKEVLLSYFSKELSKVFRETSQFQTSLRDHQEKRVKGLWGNVSRTISNSKYQIYSDNFTTKKYDGYFGNISVNNLSLMIGDIDNLIAHILSDTNNLEDLVIWEMINPSIRDVSHRKFKDGHFADSVESKIHQWNL